MEFFVAKKVEFSFYGSEKLTRGSPCADAFYGEICGWRIRRPKQLARSFPAKNQAPASYTGLFYFSFTFLSCVALRYTLWTAMDDIIRILNVGGVDSDSLAEVVADYFCGNSSDSDGMFS